MIQKKPTADFMASGDDDEAVLNKNYISITPIKCDVTDHDIFQDLKSWKIG